MKSKLLILLSLISAFTYSQNWKDYQVDVKGKIVATMVIGHLNDTIYVSGNDGSSLFNSFIYSKDKGTTWSEPKGILKDDYGKVAQYIGVKDRVYASLKLPTSDYLYYHSKDNGNTWVIDTIGLPHFYGIKAYKKDAFNLKKLGNEHIIAYNSLAVNGAYFKKITENGWKSLTLPANSNKVNFSFTAIGNTWFALYGSSNASDNGFSIAKSIDNGKTWEILTKVGLPSTMIAGKLTSNGTNKLFLGAATSGSTNRTAVYYSDDEGTTWKSTNAETLVPYTNGKAIVNLFATNNQVIVSYTSAFNQPPLFLYSASETPNFAIGNSSGLVNYPFAFPHVFFNIDNTIYLNHYNDLHALDNTSLSVESFTKDFVVNLSPNPVKNQLNIKSKKDFLWSLTSILGKTVASGKYKNNSENTIDVSNLSKGIYIFSTDIGYSKKILKN